MRAAHADYYTALVRASPRGFAGGAGARRSRQLGLELPNLRAAVRHLVDTDRLDDAADFAWSLLIYWWIIGLLRRGAGVDARAARQGAADPPAHARDGVVLRAVGRDVAASAPEVVAGLGECCGCSPRAGTRMPRPWRSPRGRPRACSCPTPTSPPPSTNWKLRRNGCNGSATVGPRRSRGSRWAVCRGSVARSTRRWRTSSGRAKSPTPAATVHAVDGGQQIGRAVSSAAARSTRPRPYSGARCWTR